MHVFNTIILLFFVGCLLCALFILFRKAKKIFCLTIVALLFFVGYFIYEEFFSYDDEIMFEVNGLVYNNIHYEEICHIDIPVHDENKSGGSGQSKNYELKNEEDLNVIYENSRYSFYDNEDDSILHIYDCGASGLIEITTFKDSRKIIVDEIETSKYFSDSENNNSPEFIMIPLPTEAEYEVDKKNEEVIYSDRYDDYIYIIESLLQIKLEVGEIYSYSATYKDIPEETKKYQVEVFEDKLVLSIDD